jgi:polyhydroxybutyrate depolymerase
MATTFLPTERFRSRRRVWAILRPFAALAVLALWRPWSGWARQRARASDAMGEDRQYTLEVDGRARYYWVHLPRGYDQAKNWPVVLNFHGGFSRPDIQRTQSRMNEVADKQGFLVVYPQGTGVARMFFWNAGKGSGPPARQNVDDVKFVRVLLDDLGRHYTVDARRVYACGMSNGAMFCYRLACELSHRIAAIGPVAGAMLTDGPRPARAVPVIHFHGLKDPNAVFTGGVGPSGLNHTSVPDTIAWWVQANHCRPEPVRVENEKESVRRTYAPPARVDGAPVVLVVLPEGGHTWPGGVDVTRNLKTGRLVQSVDASSLMWEFFRDYSLPAP